MEPQFLSQAYRTYDIPPKGVEDRIVASAEQRAAIADALDLASLEALTFEYSLRRSGKDRFKLDGQLEASLVQTCVITLESLEATVSEQVHIEFWPLEDIEKLEAPDHGGEFEIDFEGPEPIEGDVIDIGQLAYETLASAIDPYPRKPGVEFSQKSGDQDDNGKSEESPFEVLKTLKPGSN
jgi:uncharacterized metal-binding protein YceD (DUF177 family)